MPRTSIHPQDDRAEAWLARLQAPDCTAAERAAFERWRAERPDRAAAFAQAETLHRRAGELAGDPLLAAAARAALRQTAQAGARRRRWRQALPLAAAAALLLALGLGLWRVAGQSQGPVQLYATATGEQRSLRLDDGTEVLLDTDTAIAVQYDGDRREVRLEGGRAQFAVAHEAGRPFVVLAADGVVRDIGTRFQVRRQADDVTVALLDGVVSVSVPASGGESTLAPGQQVSFDRSGRLGAVQAADLAAARGWTQGDLVFKNRSLADLVAEMNRYSDTKLRLGDDSLRDLAVSGVFHAGDQSSLVQALENGWSVQARRVSAHEIVLQPAHR
ncbi:FecR domain-containing protein [Frateuria sp. Soil773]|uniref:FecR family protein n=1 Tax=Frateuria sp. Soil773 TaxID=1736407 RepID=UPI00138ECE07|nr:FecR domain-containing protein [Frateuria sp. Soil773]